MRFSLALLALFALPLSAKAQTANVVSACGTANSTYTVGQTVQITMDTGGHLCTSAAATGTFTAGASVGYSNQLRGAANTTAGTATTLIAAQGVGNKIYATNVQCWRTDSGTTMIWATLDDTVSTPVPIPAGGGTSLVLLTPLVTAANAALTFTPSTATTTVYCSAQAFSGT
jgi:hypothetical protein